MKEAKGKRAAKPARDRKTDPSPVRVDAADLEWFRKNGATIDALYAEMGKLETAKIDIYQRIQELSRAHESMVNRVFSQLGLDPSGSYDLNVTTGAITATGPSDR